jgi:hypothetical protein
VLKSRLAADDEHDYGLFAAKELPRGFGIKFQGEWHDDSDVDSDDPDRDYAITSKGIPGKVFIGRIPGCKASRANDGDYGDEKVPNNCEIVERWTRPSRGKPSQFHHFSLKTLRNVHKGEELLVSYGADHHREEEPGPVAPAPVEAKRSRSPSIEF